jgi:hypothetical protein
MGQTSARQKPYNAELNFVGTADCLIRKFVEIQFLALRVLCGSKSSRDSGPDVSDGTPMLNERSHYSARPVRANKS